MGGTQFYDQDRGTSLSATVSGLPTNGSTVYVRLKSKIGANWVNSDYTYTATSASTPAQITSPTPGSTLTSSTTTFTWNTGTGVSQYWLYVGTTQGGNQLYDQDRGTNRSATVTGLPTNGSTIHVRLWSKIGANWPYVDYTYVASSGRSDARADDQPDARLDLHVIDGSIFVDYGQRRLPVLAVCRDHPRRQSAL